MIVLTNRLEQLLRYGSDYLSNCSEVELMYKLTVDKWSKKEILGHLIDSGVNNLQRFTEIQFETKPYRVRKYKQDELVKANDYQGANTDELIRLWVSVNHRISAIITQQTDRSLNYKIEIGKKKTADLKFLIKDYVDHLEHHLTQIIT